MCFGATSSPTPTRVPPCSRWKASPWSDNQSDFNLIHHAGHPLRTGAVVARTEIGPNLMPNPDLEEGEVGGSPKHWGIGVFREGGARVRVVSDQSHEGACSAFVEPARCSGQDRERGKGVPDSRFSSLSARNGLSPQRVDEVGWQARRVELMRLFVEEGSAQLAGSVHGRTHPRMAAVRARLSPSRGRGSGIRRDHGYADVAGHLRAGIRELLVG